MNDFLTNQLLLKPAGMRVLGQVLLQAALVQLLAGAWTHLITASYAIFQSLGGRGGADVALANIYPMFWTWWIPESAFGFAWVLLLSLLGSWFCFAARHISRLLGE